MGHARLWLCRFWRRGRVHPDAAMPQCCRAGLGILFGCNSGDSHPDDVRAWHDPKHPFGTFGLGRTVLVCHDCRAQGLAALNRACLQMSSVLSFSHCEKCAVKSFHSCVFIFT